MKSKNAYLLFAILLLIFIGCQKKDTNPTKEPPNDIIKPETKSVIGGQPISINFKPYQVAIFINGQFNGGGVIINNEWILTAAHVVASYSANQISVRSGSTNLNSGGVLSYTNNVQYFSGADIALIKLSTPLVFNSNQSPAIYAINLDQIYVNDIVSVSGWGRTACSLTAPTSEVLNVVDVLINDLSNPTNINCVSPSTTLQSAWKGDSGGPLVKSYPGIGDVLIGIVSNGDCSDNGNTNYARVSYFADWIKEKTGVERLKISGPSSFCNSANYSISNLPTGATVSWSVNLSNYASLSTNGNMATLTSLIPAVNTVVLSANVTSPNEIIQLTPFTIAANRTELDPVLSDCYAIVEGTGLCFYNYNDGMGSDASIVLTNEVMPGQYEAIVSIISPNVTNTSITVESRTPSISLVSATKINDTQFKIIEKGISTSAVFKITYSGCGNSVSNFVHVRAPNGAPYIL